jgi:hypothetical protein
LFFVPAGLSRQLFDGISVFLALPGFNPVCLKFFVTASTSPAMKRDYSKATWLRFSIFGAVSAR